MTELNDSHHISVVQHASLLCQNGQKEAFPFCVQMIWHEPQDYATVCYFGLVDIQIMFFY